MENSHNLVAGVAFHWWFCGLVDGEGYLGIHRMGRGYSGEFKIKMRDDDAAILEHVRDVLGIGKIYRVYQGRAGLNGQASFVVHKHGELLDICTIFEEYPFQSRKRMQFPIWREAIEEINKGRERDNAKLARLKSELMAARQYR